jgi:hypothetical protein
VVFFARPEALRFAARLFAGRRGFMTTTSDKGMAV